MKKKGWKEIPIGGVILEAGNAQKYLTGGWRTFRPLFNKEKCTNCLLCWIYCPDGSVIVEEERVEGFYYEHCKGCGICKEVCPFGAIEMVEEAKYQQEQAELEKKE